MPNPDDSPARTVPIKLLEVNPTNPRLIFDQQELDKLVESIKNRGILVPLNVYLNEKKKFVIIDGERRYRASLQLGIKDVPVLVNQKPQEEDYVLDMFHIHHLLEPWELIPTAMKLEEVSKVQKKKTGKDPSETELSKLTGLTRSEIRRCRTVLSFPAEVQDRMLQEEAKTKEEKKLIGKEKLLTEDFFIEIDKNIIRPLRENNQKAYSELGEDEGIFQSVIHKREQGQIQNIVQFRPLAKYIRKHPKKSAVEIRRFIEKPNYSLEKLIENTGLEFDYFKFERNLNVFSGALEKIPPNLEEEQKKHLQKLLRDVKKLIDKKLNLLKQ